MGVGLVVSRFQGCSVTPGHPVFPAHALLLEHFVLSDPYRSAMSMLTFYINRAGKQLTAEQRERLEAAKDELRDLFGKLRK